MARRLFRVGPVALVLSYTEHSYLIRKLTGREVVGRYRGSIFGLTWSMLYPLLMLAVYTFVFGVVFKARWGQGGGQSDLEFALNLFAGLIVHAFFAECVSKAPNLVVSSSQYVKKVIFPLEVIGWVTAGSALFHWLVSFFILLTFFFIANGSLNLTVMYVPIIMLPYVLFLVGMIWLLAAVGTYLRDVGQITGVVVTVLLFLSPIFYPVSALPEALQSYIYLNPLTIIIEQIRRVTLLGLAPDWTVVAMYYSFGFVAIWIGFAVFQKLRKGFADVL